MKKNKTNYINNPEIGELKIISDRRLPSPEELIKADETVKVTISLDKQSVDFFKLQARVHGGQYQKLIRKVLTAYTKQTEKTPRLST